MTCKILTIIILVLTSFRPTYSQDNATETITHIQNVTPTGINQLIKQGKVCEVVGHKWESGCGAPGCCVIHPGVIEHCIICDKVRSGKMVWSE